jgi:hypothetical protein
VSRSCVVRFEDGIENQAERIQRRVSLDRYSSNVSSRAASSADR